MSKIKLFIKAVTLTIFILIMIACSGSPPSTASPQEPSIPNTEIPTPIPATDTPLPPTATTIPPTSDPSILEITKNKLSVYSLPSILEGEIIQELSGDVSVRAVAFSSDPRFIKIEYEGGDDYEAGSGWVLTSSVTVPESLELPVEEWVPTLISGLFDVGGYSLYLNCVGSGSPTVVMDLGWFESVQDWEPVQSGVAKFTQVCAYERAGTGKSDAGPTPRTSQTIVEELHTLLGSANIESPYVLVGHQIGGYDVRLFASQFPEEVAGIILATSLPTMWDSFNALIPSEHVPFIHPSFEEIDVNESASMVEATKSLGDLPLVIITGDHGHDFGMAEFATSAELNQIEALYQQMQEDLVSLSSNSIFILAEGVGHHVHDEKPEIVIDAIRTVVENSHDN